MINRNSVKFHTLEPAALLLVYFRLIWLLAAQILNYHTQYCHGDRASLLPTSAIAKEQEWMHWECPEFR